MKECIPHVYLFVPEVVFFLLVLVPVDPAVLVRVRVLEPIVRVLLGERLKGAEDPGVQFLPEY